MACFDSMACSNRSHSSKLTVAPSFILTGGLHSACGIYTFTRCLESRADKNTWGWDDHGVYGNVSRCIHVDSFGACIPSCEILEDQWGLQDELMDVWSWDADLFKSKCTRLLKGRTGNIWQSGNNNKTDQNGSKMDELVGMLEISDCAFPWFSMPFCLGTATRAKVAYLRRANGPWRGQILRPLTPSERGSAEAQLMRSVLRSLEITAGSEAASATRQLRFLFSDLSRYEMHWYYIWINMIWPYFTISHYMCIK